MKAEIITKGLDIDKELERELLSLFESSQSNNSYSTFGNSVTLPPPVYAGNEVKPVKNKEIIDKMKTPKFSCFNIIDKGDNEKLRFYFKRFGKQHKNMSQKFIKEELITNSTKLEHLNLTDSFKDESNILLNEIDKAITKLEDNGAKLYEEKYYVAIIHEDLEKLIKKLDGFIHLDGDYFGTIEGKKIRFVSNNTPNSKKFNMLVFGKDVYYYGEIQDPSVSLYLLENEETDKIKIGWKCLIALYVNNKNHIMNIPITYTYK